MFKVGDIVLVTNNNINEPRYNNQMGVIVKIDFRSEDDKYPFLVAFENHKEIWCSVANPTPLMMELM